MKDISQHLADVKAPVCSLEIKSHWDSLSSQQKGYAHFLGRASWEGARIILEQTTPKGVELFDFILSIFNSKSSDNFKESVDQLRTKSGLSEDQFEHLLEYSAQVLSNLANYKSFGDSKFIPRLSADDFEKVVKAASELNQNDDSSKLMNQWSQLQESIYSLEPSSKSFLGYPDDGHVTNYYSDNINKVDIQLVQQFLESVPIDPLNTRVFKLGDNEFEVKVASAQTDKVETHSFQDKKIKLVYGDYHESLSKIVKSIEQAVPFSDNDTQKKMLEAYIESFRTGSIEAHKESQRQWIKDVGPVVESNIGFIETYRDPAGTRAEWEGFVAVVNKERTKKFDKLVANAPNFIPLLPWGSDFEKDKFFKPDFTSLEILTFATGGIPAGINIPNYDDIRQNLGFKNVSLGNILNAKAPNEKIPFISSEDKPLYEKLRGPAFELQVGIHELLGHGTGKLLQQNSDGTFNFDKSNPPISPITNQPISTWYKPNETWGSVFGNISASYEECRAESVAMHLSTNKEILSIFGHTDSSHEEGLAEDVVYIAWLSMARAGLMALEFYDPNAKKWGQAHMQARHAILRVFLNAGENFVTIIANDDKSDLVLKLDRSKIHTVGHKAISDFLTKLHVYKSTADIAQGRQLYDEMTKVSDDLLALRSIVLAHKQPRKLFVQPNTFQESNDQFILKEYESSKLGIIRSFIERKV